VFHPQDAAAAHAAAQHLSSESVVRVDGEVRVRPQGTVNPELPTGEVEVVVSELEVLAEAETPPFVIEDRIEASEELRLRYRYLDLRRPEMTKVLAMRHAINRIVRDEMESRGFLEVETPMLGRSTPEGARDFLAPSRLWPGTFYALPQSPQQLKQLLMVAGQDRYYQIVRCLRDEQPRADRSFEFTQLDVEMSFVDEEDVFAVIEPLYARIVRETQGVEVAMPFPRMTYDEMMDRYGSDKPDLRYGMELASVGEVFTGTGFRAFASVLDSGGLIKAFSAPGGAELSRKELDELVQVARSRGAAGLVWIAVEGERIRSPAEKHLSPGEIEGVRRATGAGAGDLILIVADKPDRTNVALDGLRRHLADRLGLIPEGEWRFCWYSEPPLFDWSEEEGKWVSNHHPFTSPLTEDLAPETAKARAYDLTLNGFELGGGSIRIHRADVQRRVFEVLGLTPEQTEEQFGHLLRAFRYGVPPHGGIALGIDRLVMLMAGKDTIRDVTAFPKAQSGADPLTGAPAPATEEQLRELGIAVVVPTKHDEEEQPDG
jgi:aspartyl-tRNA synthetase